MFNSKKELVDLALSKAHSPEYAKRLEIEFKEIDKSGLWEYFIQIINSGKKFTNENNLLCAYLWGLCPENPMEDNKELNWVTSNEFPDVDIDFSPRSRDYLKEYCAKKYGKDKIVSIVNYNTFGIKSGLKDISRIFEIPLEELNFTKNLDDDVNTKAWEESIKLYPELKAFEEKYPDICRIVREFNGRSRSIGMHAGGMIISSDPIDEFIPLLSKFDEDSEQKIIFSSFPEGQHRSDTKTFGFVKQDLLGLANLDHISDCINLMEKRGKYDPKIGIFRKSPEARDWTDESYLDDKKCLEIASKGDLQMVFQFDSPGIRAMVKSGSVSSFQDIDSYVSLFRPGCLQMKMEQEFIQRKNKLKEYEIHLLLKNIIGNTYGILVYQEQIMQIMNIVGLISLQDCDNIRRAMTKKKEKEFTKYKDVFVENGQKTLGWNKEKIEELWNNIYSFSSYGFNRCITPDSVVESESGYKLAAECIPGDKIKSYDTDNDIFFFDEVVDIHQNGIKEVFEIELDNGYKIECTLDHEFLCEDKIKRKLSEIIKKEYRILCE